MTVSNHSRISTIAKDQDTHLESYLLRERIKAGIKRAREAGQKIGRPKVTDRPDFNQEFRGIAERIRQGHISQFQAANELNIGYTTLKRLLNNSGDALTD
jgi:putative DNA-invertase from lambdoid prophage Rac